MRKSLTKRRGVDAEEMRWEGKKGEWETERGKGFR